MKKLTKDQMAKRIEALEARVKSLAEGNEILRRHHENDIRHLEIYSGQTAAYARNVTELTEAAKEKDACIRELCGQVGR